MLNEDAVPHPPVRVLSTLDPPCWEGRCPLHPYKGDAVPLDPIVLVHVDSLWPGWFPNVGAAEATVIHPNG